MNKSRVFMIYAACFAINSDFLLGILGFEGAFRSTNWVILPFILGYLVLIKSPLNDFMKKCWAPTIALFCCIVSMMIWPALDPGQDGTMSGVRVFLPFITCLVTFYIFFQLVRDFNEIRVFLDAIAVSAAVNCFVFFVGEVTGLTRIDAWAGTKKTTRSGLGDPNITYMYMAIGAAYWLYWALDNTWKNLRCLVLVPLTLIGATLPSVLGLSRSASAVFVFSLFVSLLLLALAGRVKSAMKTTLIAGIAFSPFIIKFAWQRIEILLLRWDSNITEDSSASHKLESMKWFASDLISSPNILGKGYMDYLKAVGGNNYSHVTLVDVYIYAGLCGIVFLVVPLLVDLARAFWFVLRSRMHDTNVIAVNLILLSYALSLLSMSMTVSVFRLKILWAVFAVLMRFAYTIRQRE